MAPTNHVSRRRFLATTTVGCAWAWAAGSAKVMAQEPAARRFQVIGFTKPFQNLNYEETSDVVAEIGWDGIECPVRPKGQIEPEQASDELPKLVEALRRRGKELSLLTTSITRADQPQAESLLRTAARLGIRRYRLGWWKYDPTKPIASQLQEIRAQLQDLTALNRELNLQAGFQNHSGRDTVGAPVWDLWTLLKDLDPRHIGLCFDIGHATIEGGLSWPIEARLVEKQLTAVFVKDFAWRRTERGWQPEWVMLGEGMVDRAFFRWLQTTDFQGPISQHHEYDHGHGKPMITRLRKDLQVLREWLA
jgi:sugar phosphate isomerase/epimerase